MEYGKSNTIKSEIYTLRGHFNRFFSYYKNVLGFMIHFIISFYYINILLVKKKKRRAADIPAAGI